MNILQSFADETGTHDMTGLAPGSEVAAVVGYLSRKDDWANFCSDWKAILDKYHIKVFHMSEFNNVNRRDDPTWPYHGWSRDRMQSFINELVPIARDNSLIGVGGLVSVRDYDRLTPEWLKTETQHPFHFCFQLFFDAMLHAIEIFEPPLNDKDQIAFFFDRQKQFKSKALQIYDITRAIKDSRNRMGSITFVDKEKYLPIQAADLLAFRQRKVLTRIINGLPPISTGSWDEALESRHNLVMAYYDERNLPIVISEMEAARKMTTPSEFGKFDTAMRAILTVSKTELQKREKEWKRKKTKKKRA